MDDEVTHEMTLQVPAAAWGTATVALRHVRVELRDAGGTSKLVRNGEVVTLTLNGPLSAVLDAAAAAGKLRSPAPKEGSLMQVGRRRLQERMARIRLLIALLGGGKR